MKFARWEFIGVIFIVAFGILLHLAYDFLNSSQYIALFAPINDTLGETLKIVFYGMVFYALIEYIFKGQKVKNLIFAKSFSTILACFLFVVLYYGYTSFLDQNFYLNTLILIIAVLIAQTFSFLILKFNIYINGLNFIFLIVMFVAALLLVSFTYKPLDHEIFELILKNRP